jgi:hypothetical protein
MVDLGGRRLDFVLHLTDFSQPFRPSNRSRVPEWHDAPFPSPPDWSFNQHHFIRISGLWRIQRRLVLFWLPKSQIWTTLASPLPSKAMHMRLEDEEVITRIQSLESK